MKLEFDFHSQLLAVVVVGGTGAEVVTAVAIVAPYSCDRDYRS